MKKIYSMDPYFNSLKYMIAFYDVLIKEKGFTKEGLFDELNISYTSYTRAKEKDTTSSRIIIDKLNKYFNINELDYSKQDEYEETLNKVLNRFYYHGENILEFEPLILKYIDDNNYLKPVFLLMLLLIKSAVLKYPHGIFEDNEELYHELTRYKNTYYVSPFLEIYTILDIFYSKHEYKEFDKEVVFKDNMKGLIYHAYCTNAYLAGKYDLCLYYARECKDQLIKDCNYNRLSLINLTYFACLNKLGEYSKCLIECRNQLLYLTQTNAEKFLIKSTQIHYYTACIGLYEYEEVINNIITKTEITTSDYIFLLVAGSHNKKEYIKYIERFKSEESHYTEYQRDDIYTIIGYLSKKQRSIYKERLAKVNINIGLMDILLKNY